MTSASDRKTKVPLSNKKSKKKKVKGTILDYLQHETAILHITHSKWNLFAWLLKPLCYFLSLYGKSIQVVHFSSNDMQWE